MWPHLARADLVLTLSPDRISVPAHASAGRVRKIGSGDETSRKVVWARDYPDPTFHEEKLTLPFSCISVPAADQSMDGMTFLHLADHFGDNNLCPCVVLSTTLLSSLA